MQDQCNHQEEWIRKYWRPAMGWVYLVICVFDFIIFPLLIMVIPNMFGIRETVQWKSLTLEGGGLIHFAFGAVLGISSFTRGLEKIRMIENNSTIRNNNFEEEHSSRTRRREEE